MEGGGFSGSADRDDFGRVTQLDCGMCRELIKRKRVSSTVVCRVHGACRHMGRQFWQPEQVLGECGFVRVSKERKAPVLGGKVACRQRVERRPIGEPHNDKF